MKIGHVIHPSWSYDLESSLRVHRLLVERSLAKRWRFKSEYVTTGPFEMLMGYPGCGSSLGGTGWASLKLFPRDGLKAMVATVNRRILETLCSYPELASLAETIPDRKFIRCGDGVTRLADYERGRTHEQLNSHWKRATLVKDVRLECCDRGVRLNADVSFNGKPAESAWSLYWLARTKAPRWNEMNRLATWLRAAEKSLSALVRPRKEL